MRKKIQRFPWPGCSPGSPSAWRRSRSLGAPAAKSSASQAAQPTDTIKVGPAPEKRKDVAGLKPNVAERAGITEDYILTHVKLAGDSKRNGPGDDV